VSTPPPPWDNWDLLAETTAREPGTPRALAAQKAIGIIRSVLGEGWLKEADAAEIPSEVALAFSHTIAFAQLLELALRLQEFGDVPGAAVLRRNLKTDRRSNSWRHVQLQLELAALAGAAGAGIAFECGPKDGWPADVVATLDDAPVPFEAFSVFTSQEWREADRASDEIVNRVLAPQIRHNLSIVTDFHGSVLAPGELEDWLQRVEAAAEEVAKDSQSRTVAAGVVSAAIASADNGPPSRFSGPPIVFNGWERMLGKLEQKSRQASTSPDGVWLRVDVLDGIWQFSEWGRYELGQKLIVMEEHLRHGFGQTAGLAGFIVSTGAALAQGRFADEAVQSEHGSVALRRNIAPIRVRETLIVPMTDQAVSTAEFLATAYITEPSSLDRSLQLAGLGIVDEIFPRASTT
jgi:hypothetical protein